MLDPVSALGVVSFVTGTIGFLASCIETAGSKAELLSEAQKRIKNYHRRLVPCHVKLKTWFIRWCDQDNGLESRDTYIYLWGADGLEHIEDALESIADASHRIRRSIYFEGKQPTKSNSQLASKFPDSRNLLSHEKRKWQQMLERVENDSSGTDVVDRWTYFSQKWMAKIDTASVYRTVKLALWEDSVLSEKIESLEKTILTLQETSNDLYQSLQLDHSLRIQSSNDIEKLMRAKDFVSTLHLFARRLHAAIENNQSVQQWALELRVPPGSRGSLEDLDDIACIDLDFTIRYEDKDSSAIKWRAKRLQMLFHADEWDVGAMAQIVQEAISILPTCSENKHYDNFCVLPRPVSRSSPFRARLVSAHLSAHVQTGDLLNSIPMRQDDIESRERLIRKAYEVDRASIAFGVANWLLLLWGTPWAENPCTCGIRSVGLDNNVVKYVFRTHHEEHVKPPCHEGSFIERPLVSLGLTLAELALLEPLTVYLNDEKKIAFKRAGRSFSRGEMLQRIRECTSSDYKEAVASCFDWNPRIEDRSLRIEDLHTYKKRILLPVQRYYDYVMARRNSKEPEQNWRKEVATHRREGLMEQYGTAVRNPDFSSMQGTL